MSLEMMLAHAVDTAITACKKESDFETFYYSVLGGAGWDWIFQNVPPNTVRLPPPAIGPIRIPDHVLEPVIHNAVVRKNFTLGNLSFNGQYLANPQFPLTKRNLRLSLFADLLKQLGEQIEDVRFLGNPISGVTLSTSHEGGITCAAITGVDGVWELKGDTSSGWDGRLDLFRTILQVVGRTPDRAIRYSLGGVKLQAAKDMFDDMVGDSGNSCLVGVMVADLRNGVGQTTRIVSASANMCGSKGHYSAHTSRSQGSQIHMEIFLLERMGALLGRMSGTLEVADIGILGLKTSTVVSENSMCEACSGTKTTELDGNVPSKIKKLEFGVEFLGP